MTALGVALVALAALLHVYIFWLESFAWTTPRGRRTFGLRPEEAEATRELAFNQGFYNLFLAIVSAVGIVIAATGSASVGIALVLAGTGSMVAAGLVLILSSPDKARAAVVQMLFPAIAVVLLVIHLL